MSTRWAPLTLKKLLKALADVSDWRTLGINLEVNYATLDKIERDYPKSVHQMSRMLYTWLSANTGATWGHIVTALREMNLNNIAKNIEAEYRYSSQEQKSQMEQSDVSLPTSATPVVTSPRGTPTLSETASLIADSEGPPTSQVAVPEAITSIVPPPLVTSPRARSTPTLPEITPLIADSEGPPTSQVAVPEAVTSIVPPPLVAVTQIQLPVGTSAPLVNSQISPPPTTEGMLTLMDADDIEDDRLQVVEEEIGELESKFQSLVLNAEEFFTDRVSQCPRFLSKIRVSLVHIPASQKPKHLRFFEKNETRILEACTVEALIIILGRYWNWWNYSLLQHIIKTFGSHQLKDELHSYLKDLEDFEKNTIVEDFIRACHSYLGVPPEFTEVRTRMKGDWAKHTVYEIRKQARKLAQSSPLETLLVGMSHSSIVLIWAVPSTAVHVLAAAIDEEFLQSNKIESLTIDGKDLSSYQSQDRQLQTPSKPVDPQELHVACRGGNVELTLDLLDAGVDVDTSDTRDEDGRTPLMTACWHGRLDIVHLLLCFNADVNARDEDGGTPLMWACMKGYVDIVHTLVEAHADLNAHDDVGWTALSLASSVGHTEAVRAILMAGARVDAQPEPRGMTALMWASESGHSSTVRELLDGGASVNIQDKGGRTALFHACWEGKTEVVKELLQRQADVNIPSEYDGKTALMEASRRGHSSNVRELLDGGAGVNIQDKGGWTALFHACWGGRTEVVRELLQRQADVNIPSEEGLTPLITATKEGYTAVVELLLSSGKVDTEIQEQRTGWTALLIAANDGNINLVRLLLQYGANPGAVDKHGLTALDIAQEGGHTAVCEELCKYVHPQTTTDPDTSCQDPKSQPAPISPDSQDPKSQPEPISPDSQDPKSQPEPVNPGSQDKSHPRSGREHRSSSRDRNRSKTTTQSWVQEARRRLKALFNRVGDQLLPSKTEKSRVITGPGDPSHQEHSVKKKGVRPPQEVAETTSTH